MTHVRKLRTAHRVLVAGMIGAGLVVGGAAPAFAATGLTVTPGTGLSDGQTVAVAASGFTPGHTVYVVECTLDGSLCHGTEFRQAAVGADGTAQASLPAHETFVGVGQDGKTQSVDCAAGGCGFLAADPQSPDGRAFAGISFG